MEIETPFEESTEEQTSNKLVEKQGFFDPTLELSNFKRPGLDILKEYEYIEDNNSIEKGDSVRYLNMKAFDLH